MIEQAAGVRPFEIGATFAPKGHAMEFRVYAEDPGKNYRPSSGLLTEVSFPEGIRVDTWVSRGTEVSAFYDPLLAKVIVAGDDREDNIFKAKKALSEVKLCGFETNIKLLRDVLEMEDFVSGKVSTWILNDYKYETSTFEILAPGLQTTVQDYPGRRESLGCRHSAFRSDGQLQLPFGK